MCVEKTARVETAERSVQRISSNTAVQMPLHKAKEATLPDAMERFGRKNAALVYLAPKDLRDVWASETKERQTALVP